MPPDNLVEANFTWETSESLAVPTKNGFPQGIVWAEVSPNAQALRKEDLLIPKAFKRRFRRSQFDEDGQSTAIKFQIAF